MNTKIKLEEIKARVDLIARIQETWEHYKNDDGSYNYDNWLTKEKTDAIDWAVKLLLDNIQK